MRAAGGQSDSNEEPEGSGMRASAWYCDRRGSRFVDCCCDRNWTRVVQVLSPSWVEGGGICALRVM